MIDYQSIPDVSGIYAIKNTHNGKLYIGSSARLRRRAYEHFSALRKGQHFNVHLQRAWRKYGEGSFSFNVIELCSEANLLEFETKHLRTLSRSLGYNMNQAHVSTLGYKHTEAAREKIRIARAKQVIPPEVYARNAEKARGRKMNFSEKVLAGLRERARTMDRRCFKTPEFRAKMSQTHREREMAKGRPFRCIETQEVFRSTGEAGRKLGIDYRQIWRVLKSERESTHGFRFVYVDAPETLSNTCQ